LGLPAKSGADKNRKREGIHRMKRAILGFIRAKIFSGRWAEHSFLAKLRHLSYTGGAARCSTDEQKITD
jgi:hypothetical protein